MAQQIAAEAADSAAIFAYYQTWIAFGAIIIATIGTGLVWRTLRQAQETNAAALDGAKAAQEAVEEAKRANGIAAEVAASVDRAWIKITPIHSEFVKKGNNVEVRVKCRFKNVGKSVAQLAIETRAHENIAKYDESKERNLQRDFNDFVYMTTLFPGEHIDRIANPSIQIECIKNLCVDVFVAYRLAGSNFTKFTVIAHVIKGFNTSAVPRISALDEEYTAKVDLIGFSGGTYMT